MKMKNLLTFFALVIFSALNTLPAYAVPESMPQHELIKLIEKTAPKSPNTKDFKIISFAQGANQLMHSTTPEKPTKRVAWQFLACQYRTDLKVWEALIGTAYVPLEGELDKYDVQMFGSSNGSELCK